MKRITILLVHLLFISALFAQSQPQRVTSKVNWPLSQNETYTIGLEEITPFLAFSLSWAGEVPHLQIRFSENGTDWQAWQQLGIDPHGENTPERRVSQLLFLNKEIHYFQLQTNTPERLVTQLTVHAYSPGDSKEINVQNTSEEKNSPFCPCPLPPIQDRDDWCPAGNCNPVNSPTFTAVSHLVVHHSATPNTASDWAAVVRSFWDFHVNTNGWDDIGYNYLVDPNGIIYEGRGNDVQGAHFSGANGGTMGVCVIGNFTEITPTQAAKDGLREILAWKACDRNIDPQESSLHNSSNLNLNHICGHRDGPLPTACPGDMFYPQLPEIRDAVADFIANNCSNLAAPVLEAEVLSQTEVELTWTDNVDGETAFEIERSKFISTLWQPLATVPANTTSYTDTDLTPDFTYFYRVRAVNDTDTSVFSNEVEIVTTVTSLANALNTSNVQVFPNPVKDQIFIEIDFEQNGPLALQWRDIHGRAVMPTIQLDKTSQKQQFNLSTKKFPTGIYILSIRLGEETGTFKVVKN